jgi:hypothetical protein
MIKTSEPIDHQHINNRPIGQRPAANLIIRWKPRFDLADTW